MNAKLPQVVANRLVAARERVSREWANYLENQKPLGESWKPTMSEQQKQERDEYVKVQKLPF